MIQNKSKKLFVFVVFGLSRNFVTKISWAKDNKTNRVPVIHQKNCQNIITTKQKHKKVQLIFVVVLIKKKKRIYHFVFTIAKNNPVISQNQIV